MPNQMLEAALAYAARGWPIFPCNAAKQPYTGNGVLDATTDTKKIAAWWTQYPRANIGLDCAGANFMVLDLDPGHSMEELEKNVGKLPKTELRQRTPRGGEHLFFTLADGEVVAPSASKLASKVDVRSFHSYVLLAPSRTDQGPYRWEGEGRPAFRTDEMVRLSNAAKEKHEDRDNWIIEADLPENVAAAIQWLKTDAKIAVEGQGGDAMAYATAAHMKSFGISQSLALDLIWEHWNPRCIPPWGVDQIDHLETKVNNGYNYNTSPPGNITPAYQVARTGILFKPIERQLPSGRELSSGRFRFVDGDGMEHIRPPDWLVKDFLPYGAYAMIYGAHGTFKTFVALDIAMTVATGGDFPWEGLWTPNVSGPVLFALGEGRPEFKKRKRAWELTHYNGTRVKNFILSDPVPSVAEDIKPFIDGALAMQPDGYKLIVIDTVGRAMQGLNENAQEHASKFTKMVELLQAELGGTVLAIHHTGYGEDKRARGSSVFGADADTIVRLDRGGKDKIVSLTMTKQKDAPEWERATFLELLDVPEAQSLAVVKPKDDAIGKAKRMRTEPTEASEDEATVMKLVDKAIVAVLKATPGKVWSQRNLSEALAMRDDISVSSERLRKHHMVIVREDSETFANKLYDPKRGRWLWNGPG